MFRFRTRDHFILGGRRLWVSKHHSDCVRGEICFKEIVSNTRLDLNHSSFSIWSVNFLIICKFFFIYTVSIYCVCLSHLFVLLLIFKSICCLFYFITKVNCWNISNYLKADFVYILIYPCDLRWKEFCVGWNMLICNCLYIRKNLKN